MERRDPHKSREKYLRWKKRNRERVCGLTETNSQVLLEFLGDMESGLNTGVGKKGPRSYSRLNTLATRLGMILRRLQERRVSDITSASDRDVHGLFNAMRSGELVKSDGNAYQSTADYVKVFKSFWHWHMKVQRKAGQQVLDICVDLDQSTSNPPWVYLTHEEISMLCHEAQPHYRALILLLYDTGIRAPTELLNVRVCDLLEECTKLRVRDETSKTFGRTITLLLSINAIRLHIKRQGLTSDDYLFTFTPAIANRYLKRLATRVLGTATTRAGKPYSQLTLYDIRHSSACYWLPRYKSENGLKYRFGWKRTEMIHYYTELLGMHDTITKDDIHTKDDRTRLEADLESERTQRTQLEEELQQLRTEMRTLLKTVRGLTERAA